MWSHSLGPSWIVIVIVICSPSCKDSNTLCVARALNPYAVCSIGWGALRPHIHVIRRPVLVNLFHLKVAEAPRKGSVATAGAGRVFAYETLSFFSRITDVEQLHFRRVVYRWLITVTSPWEVVRVALATRSA